MMVAPLPETPPADTEFDLDVRVHAVARCFSDDPAERPQTVSCKECGTQYSCVSCYQCE
jgi:hypothetical protein